MSDPTTTGTLDTKTEPASRMTLAAPPGNPGSGPVATTRPGARPASRSGRGRLFWLAPILIVAALGVFAVYRVISGSGPAADAETAGSNPAAIEGQNASTATRVEIVRPEAGGMERSVTQPGSVSPFEFSPLFAKVSGYLSKLNVDIGDSVKQGDVLAVIDVPELHKSVELAQAHLADAIAQKKQAEASHKAQLAAVRTAEAEVTRAKSDVERTTAQRVYRKKALDRILELANRNSVERKLVDEEEDRYEAALADEHAANSGVAAAQAHLAEARAKVELALADIEDAEANISVAEADLGKAKVLADYTIITSPYTGVITQRGFHRGDFIRSAEDGTGVPLLTVARVDLMRIVVQVPERDMPHLDKGDPAEFKVDALGGRIYKGKVARFAKAEDARDRTMRTEIDLENTDGSLVGGMYGYATIILEPTTNALTIPSSCLASSSGDNQPAVFVVQDGKAHLKPIRTGRDNGVRVEVLDGLDPNDQVIERGVGALIEGTPVQAVPAPETAEATKPAGES